MIYVCNLEEMPRHATALRPSYLVSLVSPGSQPPTPPEVAVERHLRLAIHDISEPAPGQVLPEEEHVRRLIDFLRGCERDVPLLLHCFAGVSRSTAAALIALLVDVEGREAEAIARLRRAAPHAWPNARMVSLADRLLGRGGRLVAARAELEFPDEIPTLAPLVSLDRLI